MKKIAMSLVLTALAFAPVAADAPCRKCIATGDYTLTAAQNAARYDFFCPLGGTSSTGGVYCNPMKIKCTLGSSGSNCVQHKITLVNCGHYLTCTGV